MTSSSGCAAAVCESVLYDFLSEENLSALQSYLQSSTPVAEQRQRSRSRDTQMYFTQDTEKHLQFQKHVEGQIEEICRKHLSNSEAFNEYVLKNHSSDPMIDTFATLLQLSTSFEVYMDMTLDDEKRKYLFTMLRNYRSMLFEGESERMHK